MASEGYHEALDKLTPQTQDMALIESLLTRYGSPEFGI